MSWISLFELVLLHDAVIQETGGVQRILNPGGLDSALARPFASFGGTELFPGFMRKVAALIHSIMAFHPSVDGNKRTALVAADVVLRLNGSRLTPSEEVEPLFWSVARGEHAPHEIAVWLRQHTGALAGPLTGEMGFLQGPRGTSSMRAR